MTFLYPIGLLGLIGIPILILIYIIKSKYTEQVVTSTYLWTLSEKFLKRRNPLNRLTGIISLILQLLFVAVVSISIAHPVLVQKGAAYEYCFVLDGSGSMMTEADGVSRFEKGKNEILSVIEEATEGSTYSLVYVGEETKVVYEKITDREQAEILLSELSPVHTAVNYADATIAAQSYFNDNPAARIYLVTDREYGRTDNVILVNVGAQTENYAISDLKYTLDGGRVNLSAKVISYTSDKDLTVEIFVDDEKNPIHTVNVNAKKNAASTVSFTSELVDFFSFRAEIKETDGLNEDNSATVYNAEKANLYKALIVSDNPFFIESVFKTAPFVSTVTMTEKYYLESKPKGYDLYIFDSCAELNAIPTDGAIWFFNPMNSISGTGFSVQGAVTPESAIKLELSTSSQSMVEKLTNGVSGKDIHVSRYVKCGTYDTFSTLLSYKGNPMVFTGSNEYGNREVIFAFDLHHSNLPLLIDYVVLSNNLINYSFPKVIEKTEYTAGEKLQFNVVANCDNIVVIAPSGEETSLDASGETAEHLLTESGIYTVKTEVSGQTREYYIYSEFPEEERAPLMTAEEFSLLGEAEEEGHDGIYDNLMFLFIALALIFTAEWVVYCYEKYKL